MEQLGDLAPAFRRQREALRSGAHTNHARAACHSRSTVATERPSTCPVSVEGQPAKEPHSATWLLRGIKGGQRTQESVFEIDQVDIGAAGR